MEVVETIDPDHTCTVCLRLLYHPVRLQCSHLFCSLCLKKLLRSTINKACPNCRADMSDFDQENPEIDKKLVKLLKKKYPVGILERIEENKADMEEEKHKIVKKLVVGNDCTSVPKKTKNEDDKDWKRWTLYLDMENEKDDIEKYLDKIVVHLHPTFSPPVLEFKKPPFQVERVGWGVFNIDITLYFQKNTKKPPMDISWYLSFRDGGRQKTVDLEFDDRFLQD